MRYLLLLLCFCLPAYAGPVDDCYARGDYQGADFIFQASIDKFQRTGNTQAEAQARVNRAELLKVMKRFGEAEKEMTIARSLSHQPTRINPSSIDLSDLESGRQNMMNHMKSRQDAWQKQDTFMAQRQEYQAQKTKEFNDTQFSEGVIAERKRQAGFEATQASLAKQRESRRQAEAQNNIDDINRTRRNEYLLQTNRATGGQLRPYHYQQADAIYGKPKL